MNNISGVSYPVDQGVREELCRFPGLASVISLSECDRSNLEIVRLLGNAHYGHIRKLLDFLEKSIPVAGSIVHEASKLTDRMEFEAKLAELYLFRHIAQHMPDCVKSATAQRSKKRPDLIVRVEDLEVAIEVYGPRNLFGFQLVETYVIPILKFLEVDGGYILTARIEPTTENDLFYAYQFKTEREIRPWLRKFAEAATTWLSSLSPQSVLRIDGPNASGWKLLVTLEEIHQDRTLREISLHTATRSDDPRQQFETVSAEMTAAGWWGRSIRKKMAERQAGPPRDGLLRLLVVDFARLYTGFPDFICWPDIAERIDASVRLLALQIGGEVPYDIVLPARLELACCFGSPVWLGDAETGRCRRFFNLAGLTIPCEAPTDALHVWFSKFAE
jgi:hypothetical protein